MQRVVVAAALSALAACNTGMVDVVPVPAPAAQRDPAADALGALAQGDSRFLVIGGVWVWEVPGVQRSCYAQIRGRDRVRLVRFVSDVIQLPRDSVEAAARDSLRAEHADVEKYAAVYNAVIADSSLVCDPCAPVDAD